MSKVYRAYVKKRIEYATEAKKLQEDLKTQLKIDNLNFLEIVNRYDIQGITLEAFNDGLNTILSEPMVDDVILEDYNPLGRVLAIEYLPGQYDQRADATKQCFHILTNSQDVKVKCARLLVFPSIITDEEYERISKYLINPVDQRKASLDKYNDLNEEEVEIKKVPILEGFIDYTKEELEVFLKENQLAMNFDDLYMSQQYFKTSENRNPTEAEIKVLDTYWSDHCRHTTFSTVINEIEIKNDNAFVKNELNNYYQARLNVYGNKERSITLMDLATIAMKELRKQGYLDDLEVSDEVNACSIEIKVDTTDGVEDWLLMFKNETHNHPTEIEPFGGAATCLGGAIRDPLSGRSYVYQSMRITGAADPRRKLEETMKGKLPQRKICNEAAHGFSSYGNQIGLTTGYVHEIYHEGYMAKRMEIGAVVAASKKDHVKRLEPLPGHIILLIGGRTGRDGIGGATGSSKSHQLKTTTTASSEVQKGNPVEERKIQRLFRCKETSEKIIRCNDFGAGGVCVAVGELADSLEINLDAVLKKYEGLTGTELAISESQERMAVVIDQKDEEYFINACKQENLEVVRVAEVTDNNRLIMKYMGQVIVDLNRSFLNLNGAKRYQKVELKDADYEYAPFKGIKYKSFTEATNEVLSRLNVGSQKGLVEMFDSSIGNGTVLSPFGGKTLRTETFGMAALIPVLGKETTTASIMSYGFDPFVSSWSPYHGAMMSVVDSISKIVAMGGDYRKTRLTFQEYFEKLGNDPVKWGKPFMALLGALNVQRSLKIPSIGGKDSMSGSFENINVPPTLVSFAITATDVSNIITPELKSSNHKLVEIMLPKNEKYIYDFEQVAKIYDYVTDLIKNKKVYSSYVVKEGGVLEAVYKAAFGNNIGIKLNGELSIEELVIKNYGNIILEVDNKLDVLYSRYIGSTNKTNKVSYNDEKVSLNDAYKVNESVLSDVYPLTKKAPTKDIITKEVNVKTNKAKKTYKTVNVAIPVFPGTNCEYDSKKAFEDAGATVELVVIRNKTSEDIVESIDDLENAIRKAQILMLPGGFSAGDEPEGSGKFIATFLRTPKLKAAITDLIENRDGLIFGICNGFQALIKLGLLPYGKIKDMNEDDPTLTFNTIGRHVSQMVNTKIVSNASPWLSGVNAGDIHTIAVSHGEGRFVAKDEMLKELFDNNQVITQYVDDKNNPTMTSPYNPNGSMMAIEGIISKDGRIFGKMGHSERQGKNRFKNIYGQMDQQIFASGVNYFKKGKN